MINNLGTMQTHRWTPAFHTKTNNIDTLNSYFSVAADPNKSITEKVYVTQRGNTSDSVYGTKKELENWWNFIYTNKLPLFVNICLTIDEQNNSREYLPWLVDKEYSDDEVYKKLGITKEEQNLIDKTIQKFDKDSEFGKKLFSIE